MKSVFNTIVLSSIAVFAATQASSATCDSIAGEVKAKRAALAIDQVSFERSGVQVVGSHTEQESQGSWLFSVQTRGNEIGGIVWKVKIFKANCLIESVEASEILE